MTTLANPTPVDTATAARPALRPVLRFTAVALPLGWVMLTVPIVFGLPAEPFVLATTILGLFLPAVLITAREQGRGAVWTLLRQSVIPHRPLWWVAASAVVLPAAVWLAGVALDGAQPLSAAILGGFAFQFLSSAIIINLWEELAWTGFVQRRLTARWGLIGGGTATAALFALIHVPLAIAGAHDAGDVFIGLAKLITTGIGLRLLIGAVDRWSAGSLLAVALLHAGFNASSDLIEPGHDVIRLALTVVLGAAAALVVTVRTHSSRTH